MTNQETQELVKLHIFFDDVAYLSVHPKVLNGTTVVYPSDLERLLKRGSENSEKPLIYESVAQVDWDGWHGRHHA